MSHSTYLWLDELHPITSTGYERAGRPLELHWYPEAAGGLYSTVNDLALWLSANMQGQNLALPERSVLQAQTLVQMMTPVIAEESSDGLGYAIEYLSNGVKMLWHTGDIQGWRGQYALFPDLGEGIIVLTNSNTSRYFIAATICSWSQWAAQAMPGVCQVYGIILIATPTLAIFLFVLILISAVRLGLELQSGKRRVEWPPKNVLHNRDIILPLLMIFLWWLFVSPRMVGIMPPAFIWISLGFTVWCLVVALNSFMIKVGTNNL